MLNPEHFLPIERMYNDLKMLLGETKAYKLESKSTNSGNGITDQLIQLHNKLAFTLLTGDRQLLTVTGLQGSGKSTMINNLYDMDDDFLPENEGRGEQLPIVITEMKHISEPECRRVYLDKKANQYLITHEVVNKDKFKEIAMNPVYNTDIWLELHVPYRYMKDESKSIVLLPGFEKDDQHLSQQLLNHILAFSTSSIMVFRKDTYARKTDAKMVEKIKTLYSELTPIYVLTFGDIDPENNPMMVEKVKNDFSIDESLIVVKGDESNFSDPWKSELIHAVDNYSFIADEIESKRFTVIRELTDEINSVIDRLSEELEQHDIKLFAKKLERKEKERVLFDKFHQCCEQFLQGLHKNIENSLQRGVKQATQEFDEFVDKDVSMINSMKSFFSANELKNSNRYEEKLAEIWRESQKDSVEKQITLSLTSGADELVKDMLDHNRSELGEIQPSRKLEVGSERQVEIYSEDQLTQRLLTESFENVGEYFDPEKKLVTLSDNGLRVMVIVGATLARQSYILDTVEELNDMDAGEFIGLKRSDEEIKETVNNTKRKFADFEKDVAIRSFMVRSVLVGIPLILGVDAIKDGEFNTVTNATLALSSVGINISASALLGIIGGALIALKAVEVIRVNTVTRNKKKLDLSFEAKQIFQKKPKLTADQTCALLQNIFDKMEYRIRSQHFSRAYHSDDDQTLYKMQYLTNKILNRNKKLSYEVFQSGQLIM